MLSVADIAEWGRTHPWMSADQIEQDLLLSRAICEIANHDYLGEELVFRGGTALHKIGLPQPRRYSEDLDYVRCSAGGIGTLTGSLLDLGRSLGFEVKTRIGQHPKVYWRTSSQAGNIIRIKIEVNTHERSPALPLEKRKFTVDTEWWSGSAKVKIFQFPELVATKLRALYQRSKGRDLFDLWLVLTETDVDASEIIEAFEPYRPDGYSPETAINNLNHKLMKPDFRRDIEVLSVNDHGSYDVDTAAKLVVRKIINNL